MVALLKIALATRLFNHSTLNIWVNPSPNICTAFGVGCKLKCICCTSIQSAALCNIMFLQWRCQTVLAKATWRSASLVMAATYRTTSARCPGDSSRCPTHPSSQCHTRPASFSMASMSQVRMTLSTWPTWTCGLPVDRVTRSCRYRKCIPFQNPYQCTLIRYGSKCIDLEMDLTFNGLDLQRWPWPSKMALTFNLPYLQLVEFKFSGFIANLQDSLGLSAVTLTFNLCFDCLLNTLPFLFAGSPFTFNVMDASQVTASGEGLDLVFCGRPTSFTVHGVGTAMQDIGVKITCESVVC